MTKYKMRHYETLKRYLFPQLLPHPVFRGETNRERELAQNHEPQMGHNPEPNVGHNPEPLLEHDPEPQQPTLDEIWEWLGNPEIE